MQPALSSSVDPLALIIGGGLMVLGRVVSSSRVIQEWLNRPSVKDRLYLTLEALTGVIAFSFASATALPFYTDGDPQFLWIGAVVLLIPGALIALVERWRRKCKVWQREFDAAQLAAREKRLEDAEGHFLIAAKMAEAFPLLDHRRYEALLHLGGHYMDRELLAQSEATFLQWRAAWPRVTGASDLVIAFVEINLGVICHKQRRLQDAETHYKAAQAKIDAAKPRDLRDVTLELAGLHGNLSQLYMEQERFTEAEPLVLQEWQIRQKIQKLTDGPPRYTLYKLALCRHRLGKNAEAEESSLQLLILEREIFGEDHAALLETYVLLEKIQAGLGKTEESQQMAGRVAAIRQAQSSQPPENSSEPNAIND